MRSSMSIVCYPERQSSREVLLPEASLKPNSLPMLRGDNLVAVLVLVLVCDVVYPSFACSFICGNGLAFSVLWPSFHFIYSHPLVVFGGCRPGGVVRLQVSYLISLEAALLASTSLVQITTSSARSAHLVFFHGLAAVVRVSLGSGNHSFAFLEHRTAHGLLGLLAGWRCVDHLVRLQEQFVHPRLTVVNGHASR